MRGLITYVIELIVMNETFWVQLDEYDPTTYISCCLENDEFIENEAYFLYPAGNPLGDDNWYLNYLAGK